MTLCEAVLGVLAFCYFHFRSLFLVGFLVNLRDTGRLFLQRHSGCCAHLRLCDCDLNFATLHHDSAHAGLTRLHSFDTTTTTRTEKSEDTTMAFNCSTVPETTNTDAGVAGAGVRPPPPNPPLLPTNTNPHRPSSPS